MAGGLASQTVDRAVAGGRRDPAAGVRRQTGLGPPFTRNDERVLDHLFGEVDVAEETDQGCDDPTGFLTEDPFERCGVDGRHRSISRSWNGRTSTGPMHAIDPLAAHASASSRSGR